MAVALVTDFERAGLKVDWLKQRLVADEGSD
jgi:hypothetical protein